MPDYPFGEGKSLPHKKAAAAAVTAGASGSSKMAFSKELKPLKPKGKNKTAEKSPPPQAKTRKAMLTMKHNYGEH